MSCTIVRSPGRAAERIRARGVRTLHVTDLEVNAAGTQWALADDGHGAVEIDLATWIAAPRPRDVRP